MTMKSTETILDDLLKNGADSIVLRVKVSYIADNGMKVTQYFQLSEANMQAYLADWDNAMIKLSVTGIAGKQNVTFFTEIVSTLPDGAIVVRSSEQGVI